MNKSINKIVESLLIDLKQTTDESFLANKRAYLIDKIHAIRSSLVREAYRNTKRIDKQYYALWQGEVTCIQRSVTIDTITFQSNKSLYMVELPTLIQDIGKLAVGSVGNDDFSEEFTMKSLKGFRASAYNVYTSGSPMASFISNTLLLKNVPEKMIAVFAYILPYDPTEVLGFTNDSDYPCPSIYKLEMLLKKDITSTWPFLLDVNKTGNDEAIPTTQPQQAKTQK